jgi:cellulose synthase/poly-beta-1,6-N-acetylglucosamine synthase-like glycosyltransferase
MIRLEPEANVPILETSKYGVALSFIFKLNLREFSFILIGSILSFSVPWIFELSSFFFVHLLVTNSSNSESTKK